jgi:hypothetical protein
MNALPNTATGVTVTLDVDSWHYVLEALNAYQNDEDARADYPTEAVLLDDAAVAIATAMTAYVQGAN